MNFKDIHQSKTVRGIIIGFVIALIILGIFQVGIVVGEHKANFRNGFGEGYERNFMNPNGGYFMMGGYGRGMMGDFSSHGAVGEIVSINLPQIVVAGQDKLEKTILIKDDTKVREFRDDIKASELKTGDFIVVLGDPNKDGQIEARLIRVVPPPPGFEQSSSTNATNTNK